LYELSSASNLTAEESKFNAIIAKESVTVRASSFTRLTCFANGYRIRTNQLDEPVCIWLRRRTCAGDDAVSSD
jgi:hypothetical protein